MKTISAVIEKKGSGYWVYFPDIPGCVSFGDTIEKVMKNSKEAVKEFIEASKDLNEELPKILEGSFNYEYKVSLYEFFKEFDAINMTALANKCGINASLLRQYATGKKFPSIAQAKKIENSIHQLAKELLIVQF
jgi:predicted RNase H-like HicB family nuclease